MSALMNDLKNTFGFEQVDIDERRARIRRVFDTVAPRYDLMNDLMSFGIHRIWKRVFVNRVATACPRAETIIDLAGGTGDIADLLASRYRLPENAGESPGERASTCPLIVVADPAVPMMQAGISRLGSRAQRLAWLAAEGERMPFADDSVDVVTISFGLRNMADPEAALAEIARVLRPGGRFFCLEFSQPAPWLKPFYDLYSFHVIPRLGAMVARAPFAYQYLVESIRRFPGQQALTDMIRAAGLADVQWKNLSFGIAAIHAARKPA
jgi:demethylmenaquinone methyltransferase/2-methoxy-6-polyprenyl-1,4-benzoquinol methylase